MTDIKLLFSINIIGIHISFCISGVIIFWNPIFLNVNLYQTKLNFVNMHLEYIGESASSVLAYCIHFSTKDLEKGKNISIPYLAMV